MSDTREQIIERMARAAFASHFPGSSPDPVDLKIEAEGTAAALPIAVKAVTDRLRTLVSGWMQLADFDPTVTELERSGVRMCAADVRRLIYQLDAETGGQL